MHKLKKGLQTRHICMIALGGSIGTGLFLTLGISISMAGIGGAIAGYIVMAAIVYVIMKSLGAMCLIEPHSGSVGRYAEKYISKAFGFSMGWNYWLSWAITIAAEISAASLVMSFWFPEVDSLIFSSIFFTFIFLINLTAVKYYGEVEYILAFVKIATIIVFLCLGVYLVVFSPSNVQTDNISNISKLFNNGFIGFLSVFLLAGYSFQGTELVGVAAGEAQNPEKSIPKAINLVFWRIVIFYIGSLIVISLLIPFNDANILSGGSVVSNPYTKIFSYFVSTHAADIINFIILIALISAANSSLYSSSRVIWTMLRKTKVSYINKHGVPVITVIITSLIGSLCLLCSIVGNGVLFIALVTIASISCFISWLGILVSYLGYKYKIKKARLFDYKNIIVILSILSLIFIIFGQFLTFNTDTSLLEKIATYMGILPSVLFFLLYKLKK